MDVGPVLGPALRPGVHGIIHLFDARTDLGIPTVYAVNTAWKDRHELGTLVACASHLNPVEAVKKVLLEELVHRQIVSVETTVPPDPDDFTQPIHGTRYMADPARARAFDFLLESTSSVRLSHLDALDAGDPAADVERIVQRLNAHGMESFAVELTTDEAAGAGMRVIRVIVPGLQPTTFRRRVRYQAHPRLYVAPAAMGHRVMDEPALNPLPQPFG
jgi:ribosomal protein S12 methylthiotransferase accessory factor